MDILERYRPRTVYASWEEPSSFNVLWYLSYVLSLIRWKTELLYHFPGMQNFLAQIENLYGWTCSAAIKLLDRKDSVTETPGAILYTNGLLDDFKCPGGVPLIDSSLADHIRLAIENRLGILSTRLPNSSLSKECNHISIEQSILVEVSAIQGSGPTLQNLHHPSFVNSAIVKKAISHLDQPAGPPCLHNAVNKSSTGYAPTPTDYCCCGWVAASIPSSLLQFLRYSTEFVAQEIHAGLPCPESFGTSQSHIEKNIKNIFPSPEIDELALKCKMAILGEVVCSIVTEYFSLLRREIARSDLDIADRSPIQGEFRRYCPILIGLISGITNCGAFWASIEDRSWLNMSTDGQMNLNDITRVMREYWMWYNHRVENIRTRNFQLYNWAINLGLRKEFPGTQDDE